MTELIKRAHITHIHGRLIIWLRRLFSFYSSPFWHLLTWIKLLCWYDHFINYFCQTMNNNASGYFVSQWRSNFVNFPLQMMLINSGRLTQTRTSITHHITLLSSIFKLLFVVVDAKATIKIIIGIHSKRLIKSMPLTIVTTQHRKHELDWKTTKVWVEKIPSFE